MGIMLQSLLPTHLTDSTNVSDMRDMWSLGSQSSAISAWTGKNSLLALQIVLSTFMIISCEENQAHDQACIDVAFHPVIPNVIASCSWDGSILVFE